MTITNILADHGFGVEHTGGGCYVLDKSFPCGSWVWVSTENGDDVPTHADWRVCVYPANYWDADGGELIFDAHSEDYGAATVFDAIAAAADVIAARNA
jgi:hypothetical protein